MEKYQIQIKKIIPMLCIVTYGLVLYFILGHLSSFTGFFQGVVSVLKPVIIGGVIAFLINIPMSKIEKGIQERIPSISKHSRMIAMLLTYILTILLVIIILIIIIPQLLDSLTNLVNGFGDNVTRVLDSFSSYLEANHLDNELVMKYLNELENIPWDQVISKVLNYLSSMSGSISGLANDIYSSILILIGKFTTFFTGFMISIYFLNEKEAFKKVGKKVLLALLNEKHAKEVILFIRKVNTIYSSFIGGQLIECCILGTLFFIGLSILRMPYALLISIIIAITALIPIFGAMIGMCIGILLILPYGIGKAVLFVVFFQVLQQIENNLIYPRVVGSSVGLPPVLVLISIILFGKLFGVIGMVIAVPTGAVVYSLFTTILDRILAKRQISEEVIDYL